MNNNKSKKSIKRTSSIKKKPIKRTSSIKKKSRSSVKSRDSKKNKSPIKGGANKIVNMVESNIMRKTKDEDKKCAPSKKYEEGSCFTLKSLQDMANAYNRSVKTSKNKIIISDQKKPLLEQLNDRLKKVCDDQLCWIKQDFINYAKDKHELKYLTFRPTGPQGRFTWLNTTNINHVMKQYEKKYNDFKFLGAVPIDFDELPSLGIYNLDLDKYYDEGIHRFGIIFNTDEHYKSGAHWIAMFFDIKKYEIYFFDSYAKRPEKRIRTLVGRISKWCNKKHYNLVIEPDDSFMAPKKKNNIEKQEKTKILFNQNRKQFKNSECGVYSINFILRLLKGETFQQIVEQELPDDEVNKCRNVYFTFDDPTNINIIDDDDIDDFIGAN